MFIFRFILVWMMVGLVVFFAASAIHLYRAEKNGYAAIEWWNHNERRLFSANNNIQFNLLVGLIIWPAKLTEFIFITVPVLYEQYDLHE